MALVEWSTPFVSSVVSYDDIIPNTYEITVGISPTTDDTQYQNIGFERIKFFLRNICQNSILISVHNKNFKLLTESLDTKFMTLPDEPYDQLMIVVLFHKLDAILDKHFHCEYISLESFQGENIRYNYNEDYDSSFVDEKEYFPMDLKHNKLPWWYRKDTTIRDTLDNKKIKETFSWADLELSYRHKKTEKSKGEVVNLKKFSPKVIDGNK